MGDIYVARSSAVAARRLGGEMIVMSAADSTLFNLNETATMVWEAADGRTPLSEIVSSICEEFEVAQEDARRDAEELVRRLAAHRLVTVSESPIEA